MTGERDDESHYPGQEELRERKWLELPFDSPPQVLPSALEPPESKATLGRPKKPLIWTVDSVLDVIEDAAAEPDNPLLNELGFTNGSLFTRLRDRGYFRDLNPHTGFSAEGRAMGLAFERAAAEEPDPTAFLKDAMRHISELARDIDYLLDGSPCPMLKSTHEALHEDHRRGRGARPTTGNSLRAILNRLETAVLKQLVSWPGIRITAREQEYDNAERRNIDTLAFKPKTIYFNPKEVISDEPTGERVGLGVKGQKERV